MAAKLDERDLAVALSDVLDRVRRGERFIVERDGAQLAILSPPIEPLPTGRGLADKLGGLMLPGEGFSDEIETARSRLIPVEVPASPD